MHHRSRRRPSNASATTFKIPGEKKVELLLPPCPAEEQAIERCKSAYDAAKGPYTEAKAQLENLLAQLPPDFSRDAAPTKGSAKVDPALLEELDAVELTAAEKKQAVKVAKVNLGAAERALIAAKQREFVRTQSEKNVHQTRQMMTMFVEGKREAAESMEAGVEARKTEERHRKDLAALERAKRIKERAALSCATGLEDKEDGWINMWDAGKVFGEPARAPPTTWIPPPPAPQGENPALRALKQALGQNMGRVTDLLKQWDVDCDHTISIVELRNALGALRVPFDEAALLQLFNEVDLDQNGSLDFEELHKALRREAPRRAPLNQVNISLVAPKRQEPNPLGTGHERRAVAALKRALHLNLGRIATLFTDWDYDGNGLISKREMRRALAAQSIEVDRLALDTLFLSLDADNSGGIDFKELNRMLRREFVFETEVAEARLLTPAGGVRLPPAHSPQEGIGASPDGTSVRPQTVPAGVGPRMAGNSRGRGRTPGLSLSRNASGTRVPLNMQVGGASTNALSKRQSFERNLRRGDQSELRELLRKHDEGAEVRMGLIAPPGGGSINHTSSNRSMAHSKTEPMLTRKQ